MSYTVQDLLVGIGAPTTAPTGGVWAKLSQRADVVTYGKQWIADAVIELSRDYPFQDLEETTPNPVQMTNGQYIYDLSTWLKPGDTIANLVPSFYMFYQVPAGGGPGPTNPGIGLKWKTIDALELMFNTPGAPAFWSRWKKQIYIAPVPDNSYYSYMRYQKQHPFSNPVALTDQILLPDEWREIVEYSAALRGAGNLRMLDYAADYRKTLFGDPKDPTDVGLIAHRVSQDESDTVSNAAVKQLRPTMRR